jgi:hypothetical protein
MKNLKFVKLENVGRLACFAKEKFAFGVGLRGGDPASFAQMKCLQNPHGPPPTLNRAYTYGPIVGGVGQSSTIAPTIENSSASRNETRALS